MISFDDFEFLLYQLVDAQFQLGMTGIKLAVKMLLTYAAACALALGWDFDEFMESAEAAYEKAQSLDKRVNGPKKHSAVIVSKHEFVHACKEHQLQDAMEHLVSGCEHTTEVEN